MASLRRRLRLVAVVWLAVQAASVSALVPRDCCATHQPKAAGCHKRAAATYCPMRSADGTPCPMHRSSPAEEDPDACAMRGTCDGPMAALVRLLSHHAVLDDPLATLPDSVAGLAFIPSRENPIGRRTAPETPPPRA